MPRTDPRRLLQPCPHLHPTGQAGDPGVGVELAPLLSLPVHLIPPTPETSLGDPSAPHSQTPSSSYENEEVCYEKQKTPPYMQYLSVHTGAALSHWGGHRVAAAVWGAGQDVVWSLTSVSLVAFCFLSCLIPASLGFDLDQSLAAARCLGSAGHRPSGCTPVTSARPGLLGGGGQVCARQPFSVGCLGLLSSPARFCSYNSRSPAAGQNEAAGTGVP